MPRSSLSVIVIVKNEERDLPSCLDSVKGIADEIVVVDSGSSDKTVEIAKQYTDKVYYHEWLGYSGQKQFALEKTVGQWVLNIDADERVSAALRTEIELLLSAGTRAHNGYKIPFRNFIFGRRLRFGSGIGETHLRLFRRDCAAYGSEKIHEGIRVKPPIGQLRNAIDHCSYRDVSEYLSKCNEYTSLIADRKFKQGRRFHVLDHLRWFYEFLVRYVFKAGFLDGSVGFSYALLSSTYVWLKFLKLKDLENKKDR